MKILSVEFAGAIGQIGQKAPETLVGLPQVAVSGRSNVGKSSLINRFLGRTRTPIARVSQTPGKTQEINFYHVRSEYGEFVLVDLPGYGFARAPDGVREHWAKVIQSFLDSNEALLGMIQLLDIRHTPTPEDLAALDQLVGFGLPTLIVLTKADKLKLQKRQKATRKMVEGLGVDSSQLIVSSSLSGMGMDELKTAVAGLIFPSADTENPPS